MHRVLTRLAAISVIAAEVAVPSAVSAPASAAVVSITEVAIPASVRPGDTLVLTWRVQTTAGLATITADSGAPAPGTWVKIGGSSGWVRFCPFPINATRISGSTTDGVYRASCVLPTTLPADTFSVWISALDSADERAETGGTDTFTIDGGVPDTAPPVVTDVTVSPARVVPGEAVTIAWRGRDATGVKAIGPWAYGPNGRLTDADGVLWLAYDVGMRTAGDALDGRYAVRLATSANAVPGSYIVWFSVEDVLGNREASLYPNGPGTVYATYDVVMPVAPTPPAPVATPAPTPLPVIAPATRPDAPVAVTTTRASATRATVAVTPGAHGGSPIVDYDMQLSTTAGFTRGVTFMEAGTSAATTMEITTLKRGTTYYVRVRASNAVGDSPWSVAAAIRP